jgi:hypothetical protein
MEAVDARFFRIGKRTSASCGSMATFAARQKNRT